MEKNESTFPEERTLLEGILHYLSIILKYKKMVVIVTGSAMIGVVIFSVISLLLPPEKSPLPNKYRSYAVIMFQGESGGGAAGMSSMLSTFGIESTGGSASPSQLALEVLRSRPFVDDVAKEFNVVEKFEIDDKIRTNSRKMIIDNSAYAYNQDSGALTIAYTSIYPQFAADLVNYEVELLEKWFQKEGVSTRANQLSLMEEKLEELRSGIGQIEEEIESFQIEHGALDITQLAESQAAILLDLRTTLNQIELEISQYTEYSTIEDPALVRLKTQRSNIINQIRRVEQGYISSDGKKIPSTDELPQLSLEFAHMRTELELQMQLYQTLSERYEVTKLTAAEESVFSVLEYAEVPEEKTEPSRGQLCMIVSVGAFFGSLVLALMLNMLSGIIADPKKVKILKGEYI